jgi:hypothetical protein
MSRRLSLRALAFTQAMLLLATLLLPALVAAATIQTDLFVYNDGDTVHVTGVDFGASEVVDFVTTDPNGTTVDSGTAESDAQGGVAYDFTLHVTVSGLYTVTGTGETSGSTASVQFDPPAVQLDNLSLVWHRTGEIATGFDVSVTGKYTCEAVSGSGGGTKKCAPDSITIQAYPSSSSSGSLGTIQASRTVAISTNGTNVSFTIPLRFGMGANPNDWLVSPAGGKYDLRAVFAYRACTGALCTPTTATPEVDYKDDQFGVDNTAPAFDIVSATPGVSAVSVGGTASDTPSGFGSATITLFSGACPGATQLDTNTFSPGASWSKNLSGGVSPGTYCVSGSATDLAGNQSSDSLQYSIDAPATVNTTSPANGASGVAVGSAITVNFSEPVNVATSPQSWLSLNCGGGALPGVTTGNGTSSVTFQPSADLPANATCNAQVQKNQVADVDSGLNIAANYPFSFSTVSVNTPPVVTVTGVTDGGSYAKGSVPVAGCSVVDVEDGSPSVSPVLSAISGPDAGSGIGSQTATCSYTDTGGLPGSASATYTITDATAPSIDYTLTPSSPDGNNGWYTGHVTLTWTVSEGDSPSTLVTTGCINQDLTADQAETSYSCSATSSGGSAGPVTVKIKIDGTAPVITGAPDRAPNVNDWYNADVTVSFTCSDALSGTDTNTVAGDNQTLGEGAGQSVSSDGDCTDKAGNVASTPVTVSDINIDETKPSIVITTPGDGDIYFLNSAHAANWSCLDFLSGLDGSCTSTTANGANVDTSTLGSKSYTVSGTDLAGNTNSVTHTYSVIYNFTGFFQPVDNLPSWNSAKAGQSIPVKFNLGGNQGLDIFKTGYPKVTQVQCPNGSTVLDAIETYTSTAGGSTLTYDTTAMQYIYVWKTDKAWAGKCFSFQLGLKDGTNRTFQVSFVK